MNKLPVYNRDWRFLRKAGKDLLDFGAQVLNAVEGWTLNFHPHRGLGSGQRHIQPIFHRHSPRVGESGKLEFPGHLLDQFFVGHAGPPLFPRLEHHGGVVHIERRIVGGAIRAAHRAEDAFDFGKGAQHPVLLLQQLGCLRDAYPGQ